MKKFLLQISTSQQEMVTFQFETRSEAMMFHQRLFDLLHDYDISNTRCYLTELVEPQEVPSSVSDDSAGAQ
ncbi:hypothetical protein [Sigmofec virus UA08Rod_6151]|uniref:Uncharacterized protein n=1 Tax=Sigmofec virus UA08Rod_6151 TaxID=2929224 RepID=A0A976N0X8_9VIRU|nr:hypothetical protein [Sigmofec virus UA08Rod_6151]